MGAVAPIDRLTGPDLSGFVPERLGRPTDIGVIAVLDAACLLDGDGRVHVDAVRERIDSRLHLVPRLRQVVHRPTWVLGRPFWADDVAFDLGAHVRVHRLGFRGRRGGNGDPLGGSAVAPRLGRAARGDGECGQGDEHECCDDLGAHVFLLRCSRWDGVAPGGTGHRGPALATHRADASR